MTAAVALVLLLTVLLGLVTGFRDAPNAVALPVRFRALSPRIALLMAAVLNTVGTLLGMGMLGAGIALVGGLGALGGGALTTLTVALTVALTWGLLLWWLRMPISMTHAVLAAIAAAHLAAHVALGLPLDEAFSRDARRDVLLGLTLSPVLAWGLTRLLTPLVVRLGTTGTTVNVQHRARLALALSSGMTALGHGLQAGQRLGTVWLLTAAGALGAGLPADTDLTWPYILSAVVFAAAVGAGTLGGAWRIGWTLTERLVILDPLRASVAAAVPAVLLFLGSLLLHLPLSSTHTLTASIVAAGQTQTYASVRWPTLARVVAWWLLTPLVCGALAFALGLVTLRILG